VYRLIVFDLDGTLLDTRRDLACSANELLQSYGGQPLAEDAVVRLVGEGARVLVERAFAAARLGAPPAEALVRFLEIYDRHLIETTEPYAGVGQMLAAACVRHTLALLTNKPTAPAIKLLNHFGFRRYFRHVFGGDGRWLRKPAPDGLLGIAATNGARAAETLMVGDSRIDHQTARNAATPICLARYGFGWEQFPQDALAGDELFIDAPGDLLDLI
jgi:phosphoglycolate phosphatase